MDAFSFLKYWRSGGAAAAAAVFTKDIPDSSSSVTTAATIVTAVNSSDSDNDHDHDQNDEGPFFDLEFTLPEDDTDADMGLTESVEERASGQIFENPSSEDQSQTEQELVINFAPENKEGDELKFTVSSSSAADSPAENFKEHLTPVESYAVLKSAKKLGVLMFKFKKSKSNVNENPGKSEVPEENSHQEKDGQRGNKQQKKLFTVKLKVEEVPLVSLFTKDFSSKGETKKANKKNNVDVGNLDSNPSSGKDVMSKYLRKVKPLHVHISKRYAEKLGSSGQLTELKSQPEKSNSVKSSGETSPVGEVVKQSNMKSLKLVNLQARLRVVYKQLGKSRSDSPAAVADAPAAPAASSRRDDSLLQQQDGIQSAILHCKRSFNASRDMEASVFTGNPADETEVSLRSEDSPSSTEKAKGI